MNIIITLLWWSLGRGNRVVPSSWQATVGPRAGGLVKAGDDLTGAWSTSSCSA
jgi:hypothetical protein